MYIAYLSSYQSCYKYKLMKKEMLMLKRVQHDSKRGMEVPERVRQDK